MDTRTQDQIAAASTDWKTETRDVPLAYPFQRGDKTIDTVTLRYPAGSALNGIGLKSLLNELMLDDIKTLVPRICSDITVADIKADNVHLADLTAIGTEIMLFFAKPDQRTMVEAELEKQTKSIT